jgi:hypothetical protein
VAFLDLAAELAGTLPGLSPALAESYVTRAWQDITRARHWSFLGADAVLVCPAAITAGTVHVTLGSTTVTADTAATTALTPAITATPPLTSLQFRLPTGSLYSIAAVSAGPPVVLTLDRAFSEPTALTASYQIYRAYLTEPPATDFMRWESLDDVQNQYAITGPRLTRSRVDIDRRDPARQSQGQARELAALRGTPTPLWELWPHPTSGQTFLAFYRTNGGTPDYTDPTSTPPAIIPESLILHRALAWYGYPWAQVNKGSYPRYQRTELMGLLLEAKKSYEKELLEAKTEDDEVQLNSVYNRGWRGHARPRLAGLLGDAAYWQSHPIRF